MGPLPVCEGYRYLLTVVDRFSRWPEAFPLRDIPASSCCCAFTRNWLPRFGVPDEVVTDRGAQFTGSLWSELMSKLGVSSSTTTAYHPQANGLVERMHRHLKSALKARLSEADWMDDLAVVLLGLRSAWRQSADTSPAELLYGVSLRLPGQFIPGVEADNASANSFTQAFFSWMQNLAPVPSVHHSSSLPSFLPSSLRSAKQVYAVSYTHLTLPTIYSV